MLNPTDMLTIITSISHLLIIIVRIITSRLTLISEKLIIGIISELQLIIIMVNLQLIYMIIIIRNNGVMLDQLPLKLGIGDTMDYIKKQLKFGLEVKCTMINSMD